MTPTNIPMIITPVSVHNTAINLAEFDNGVRSPYLRCGEPLSIDCNLLTSGPGCSKGGKRYPVDSLDCFDVSFSYVCPVIDHEFIHNIDKIAVDARGDG